MYKRVEKEGKKKEENILNLTNYLELDTVYYNLSFCISYNNLLISSYCNTILKILSFILFRRNLVTTIRSSRYHLIAIPPLLNS